MNVYFVNRYSKIKGPFDIIDSNRQHIIKVGDVCLRDTNEGVAFYVVYNSNNAWNACKLVGIGRNDVLSETGNTLLFSFDGLSKRKGDIALIKQLIPCFREKVVDEFWENAVDILEYRKDFWDGSLFPRFFAASQELIERDDAIKPDLKTDTNRYPSVFAKYLSKEMLEMLIASLNEGNDMKDAYMDLRDKHPEMFRKALMKFLTENPSGTIFDKPADAYEPTVTVSIENVPTVVVKEVENSKSTSRNVWPLVISEKTDSEPLKIKERTDKYLSEIYRQELVSIEEEVELAQKNRKGEIDARNKLVRANMRFVVGIAKQFLHNGLEFEDLLQEGFLGIIKASGLFDETRGFSFIVYAPWWIRRYLTNAIVSDSSLIRFPLNMRIQHRRIWDFKIKYEQQIGFLPPISEIEIEGEDNLERISFLDSLPSNLRNICVPCDNLDVFEDDNNAIEDYENDEYNKYYVRSLLARLSKRERNILKRFFGIGVKEETLEIIGESHGLTRERVRQIKEKTISKLREIVFATSAGVQSVDRQNTQEEITSQSVTTKNVVETRTLKDVKKEFLQLNMAQLTEMRSRMSAERDNVILPSSKSYVVLDACNYSVENGNSKCNIYDYNKKLVYSSTGSVKEINNSYYRVCLNHFFFSIGLIKRNDEGKFFNGANILLANRQSALHHKLNCKGFIEMIEDVELDGRRRVKVDGCWYDERGNKVFETTKSNSCIIEEHVETKESTNEEIVQGEEFETDEDVEEVVGTNENEIEHAFLNSKVQVEETSMLPICSESRSGKPWSSEEEKLVSDYYKNGQSFYTIAKAVGRTEIAVMSRLGMLGVIDYSYGQDYKPKEHETLINSDVNEEEQEFNGEELADRYHYPVQDSLFWDDGTKQVYEIYLADNYDLIINHLIFDYNKLNEIEAHLDGLTEDEKEELFSNYWYDNHINIIARIKPDTEGYEALKLDSGIDIQEIVYEPGKYTSIKYTEDDKDIFIDYNGSVFNTFEQIVATPNTEVAKYHNFYDAPKYITKEYIRLRMIEIKRVYKGAVKKVTIYVDSELGQVLKNNSEEVWMLDFNAIITKTPRDDDNSYPFKVYFRNGVKIDGGNMETVKGKSFVLQDKLKERISKLQTCMRKKKERIRFERQLKEIVSTLFFFEKESTDEEDNRQ